MSEVLVIQNARLEGLAALKELFHVDGFKLKTIFAKKERIPSIKPDLIIILGAPESANDDLPHLKKEIILIQDAVKKNIPVLGICLGSQLIAKAFGAKVYQGARKEIGFYKDVEFDNESKSRIFNGIKRPAVVFHWHGDTFDLPKDAIRLAHSQDYKNQAIKIGSAVGVQFHLEVDEETIRTWIQNSSKELNCVPYVNPEEIVKKIPENLASIKNNLRIFYQNFKAEFSL